MFLQPIVITCVLEHLVLSSADASGRRISLNFKLALAQAHLPVSFVMPNCPTRAITTETGATIMVSGSNKTLLPIRCLELVQPSIQRTETCANVDAGAHGSVTQCRQEEPGTADKAEFDFNVSSPGVRHKVRLGAGKRVRPQVAKSLHLVLIPVSSTTASLPTSVSATDEVSLPRNSRH